MQPHLIVTDLDNTLLNAEHDLDELTIETFQALAARGHHLALASGRHFHDITAFRRRLGVPAYIMSTNGAHLYGPDDSLIAEQWVPAELVRALVELPRGADIRLNLYTGEEWLIDASAPELKALHAHTGFHYRVADLEAHDGRGVGKVLCIGDPEALAALEQSITETLGTRLHMTYSMAHSLEIMAEGVNKGATLERLLAHLGLPAARCLAFGDNLNDAEMLALAGHGFVMENAHPDLPRRVPDAIRIGHHHPNGVAWQLRDFFSLA
ncbi:MULTISPECIES: Cof-type HAD-IIB family hydrolase [Chromohalobacter]|uniref:Cof protein n=1 Tax=Chromohalobacter israelensis (strain ATCC BAA-138 / DSM 3043 / CIP 106854 / NCIMB 13768 / 1H11) TaxID=290398 RepID=Q1QY75_CHRI1|nr:MULTISPECIES: Cof-type HAD-IIB family hydrolase [Chromohalobacter]ABE58583.1 Cof protein [Chromohalobacter salexigens DSM 3043]MBZ5875373.1 Cof-type HAD-IIB family hydrolase [Chromohalobacter salexigens]MDF9433057.1 Cof-type HAD-IIB family hydrolase [Chromohalobacter israelensis]NQY44766.1 Cof-type HAD-IIB family hydrolase [Chromohalobacter sp.]RXE47762.1 haloacid dehalogenase [Chromohalobacter salexigens]